MAESNLKSHVCIALKGTYLGEIFVCCAAILISSL